MKKKHKTPEEAQIALTQLCSIQENCTFDAKQKLNQWRVPVADAENIIENLTDHNFINNQRYCIAFANDKIFLNKWGKHKVEYVLKQKQLAANDIQVALNEIEQKKYIDLIKNEITKKAKTLKPDVDSHIMKNKLWRFAQQRGYEFEIASKIIESFVG